MDTQVMRLAKLYWELPSRANTSSNRRYESATGPLPTYESYKLVDQVAAFRLAEIEFSGANRGPHISGLLQMIDYATRRGVRTSYALPDPAGLTPDTFVRMKKLGLGGVAVRFDGANAETHEALVGDLGSYDAAVLAVLQARNAGLPVRIDTMFTRGNLPEFARLAALAGDLDATAWNVSLGFSRELQRQKLQLRSDDVELLFELLFDATESATYRVQTSSAKHYRRFLLQRFVSEKRRQINSLSALHGGVEDIALSIPSFRDADERSGYRFAEQEIVKQRASLFVNVDGAVWPERQLPLPLGNVRSVPLQRVVTNPLGLRLRNADELKGKCAACEFRELCGGSRTRAYQATADPFEADPLCAYQPKRWRDASRERAAS